MEEVKEQNRTIITLLQRQLAQSFVQELNDRIARRFQNSHAKCPGAGMLDS